MLLAGEILLTVELRYPEMRVGLVSALERLVNAPDWPAYTENPHTFDDDVNDLFWLLRDNGDPVTSVGYYFLDAAEAEQAARVLDPLDAVIGPSDRPFAEVRQHGTWPDVVRAAQQALDVLRG